MQKLKLLIDDNLYLRDGFFTENNCAKYFWVDFLEQGENEVCKELRKIRADRFYVKKKILFLAVGAKAVLEYNLCLELGLSNSCTSIVKEIVYGETVAERPPALPKYCWVYIDEYVGDSFFPPENEERNKWVPIYPVTAEEYTSSDKTLFRTMLPLCLAWVWTIWKAQGQTICTKIILNLGSKEKEHGLFYVAFSRATKLSNLGIT